MALQPQSVRVLKIRALSHIMPKNLLGLNEAGLVLVGLLPRPQSLQVVSQTSAKQDQSAQLCGLSAPPVFFIQNHTRT